MDEGDYWYDYDYDDWSYEDPPPDDQASTVGPIPIITLDGSDWGDEPPGGIDDGILREWQDNLDGSFTDLVSGEVWADDVLIGTDNFDGTWIDINDNVRDYNANVIGVMTAEGPIFFDQGTDGAHQAPRGFFDSVGDFFSGLLGTGSANANTAGAVAMKQIARQLAQARASNAPPQTISTLQNQLAQARSYNSTASSGKTILIALGVGVGVYALTRRRDN